MRESIKGEENLNKLLNKGLNKTNDSSDSNLTFENISTSIRNFHSAGDKENEKNIQDNVESGIVGILNCAENGFGIRISNMQVDDINKFKEEFERVKMDHLIIKLVTQDSTNKYSKRKKQIEEKSKTICHKNDMKIKCIHEILESDIFKNKTELLQELQQKQTVEEINKFIYDNIIILEPNKEVPISKDVFKEHNLEYLSHGMEWDNSGIIQYIKSNQQEIMNTEGTKKFGQKILNPLKNYIFNSKNNQTKLLSERNEPIKPQKHSWDLENWGIDKEQFMQDSQDTIKESIKNQQQIEPKINTQQIEMEEI